MRGLPLVKWLWWGRGWIGGPGFGRIEQFTTREFDWIVRLHYAEHLKIALNQRPLFDRLTSHEVHLEEHIKFRNRNVKLTDLGES